MSTTSSDVRPGNTSTDGSGRQWNYVPTYAKRGTYALAAEQQRQGHPDARDMQERIVDAIADMLHLAACCGVDPDEVSARATDHYTSECECAEGEVTA